MRRLWPSDSEKNEKKKRPSTDTIDVAFLRNARVILYNELLLNLRFELILAHVKCIIVDASSRLSDLDTCSA